jgi:hypothetical protein
LFLRFLSPVEFDKATVLFSIAVVWPNPNSIKMCISSPLPLCKLSVFSLSSLICTCCQAPGTSDMFLTLITCSFLPISQNSKIYCCWFIFFGKSKHEGVKVSDIRCAKFGCVLGSKYMTPHTLPAQLAVTCWKRYGTHRAYPFCEATSNAKIQKPCSLRLDHLENPCVRKLVWVLYAFHFLRIDSACMAEN